MTHWGKWVPQGLNAQVKTSSGGGITMPIHSRLHGTMNWRGFPFLIATTIEVRLRWHGSTVEKKEQSSGVRDSPLCSALVTWGVLPKLFRSLCLALIWTRQIYPCTGCQCRSLWSIWQHLRKKKNEHKSSKQIQPKKETRIWTISHNTNSTARPNNHPFHNSNAPIYLRNCPLNKCDGYCCLNFLNTLPPVDDHETIFSTNFLIWKCQCWTCLRTHWFWSLCGTTYRILCV